MASKGETRKKKKPSAGFEKLTATAVAELFGVSTMAVSKWQKTGCPRNPDKSYDLKKVIAWREAKAEQERTVAHADSPGLERYRLAKAEREELKLAQDRKELLLVSDVSAGNVDRIRAVRAGLIALKRGLAPRVLELDENATLDEAESLIWRHVEVLLNTFAGNRSKNGRGKKTKAKD
jgi:predicted transcriptional regulator